MRITVKHILGQLLLLITVMSIMACNARKDETPVIPPVTSPLSRDYIGYGVITASFTHITAEPAEDSSSLGYLRRGSLVRIIKRQTVRTNNIFEFWVQVDGVLNGWLKEDVMDIYNNESQAKTASESILR
jgi:hypothetical protein